MKKPFPCTFFLFKVSTLIDVMSNPFMLLHGGFIFIQFVTHITENLTGISGTMLILNMSLETGRMNKLETEPTLSLASRI